MILFTQICSIIALLAIAVQDFKERKVYLWLMICAGGFMAFFYLSNSQFLQYMLNIGLNMLILLLILSVLIIYSKYKLKKSITSMLGMGDMIFFAIIAIGFPTFSFVILFTGSILFSLITFFILKSKMDNPYVPLAGLQALFFLLVFSSNWLFQFTDLYAL